MKGVFGLVFTCEYDPHHYHCLYSSSISMGYFLGLFIGPVIAGNIAQRYAI